MATSIEARAPSKFGETNKRHPKKTSRYFDTNVVEAESKPNSGKQHTRKAQRKRPVSEGEEEEPRWKKEFLKSREKKDPFEGPPPLSEKKIKKYVRGQKNKVTAKSMPDLRVRKSLKRYEERLELASKQAARTELLLPEDSGFLEADEGEETYQITQQDISEAVDIASATKSFELKMDRFGPYRLNYTRTGRHLLLAGRLGHLAAMDWVSKKLMFEINVMESIREVRWLHLETMLAVAQKKWLYMYDNHGVEIHCIKNMNNVLRMEFLPHHFLLATANAHGVLQYLDTSVGKMVSEIPTKCGRLDVMTHNPNNAIVHLGHPDGTVTLWSPTVREPVVKMLCHKAAVRALAIDSKGLYMATAGTDRQLKIFDVRTYKPLQVYRVSRGAGDLSFSQRGLLAASLCNVVEVYKDCCTTTIDKPYMRHTLGCPISGLSFCPYEDVLGVTHSKGYASLLLPGAGEPNFDALEANPYRSKTQRREFEVKALLEKIQPELITLDPQAIGYIDTATMDQRDKEKRELFGIKPPPKFEPRFKKKGRSTASKKEQRKQGHKEEEKREKLRQESYKVQDEEKKAKKEKDAKKSLGHLTALDRFKK
ncbi:WD repeat-containing protein 46-like [Patiria miniata]|uniref:WD repeat-containing protein 46 n=1 Tax=Patiria miniata TaxID=46514 RepID=A0A914AJR1_PATMI|nr:WD repeat-containing protein 46-like [Patiria miniata]